MPRMDRVTQLSAPRTATATPLLTENQLNPCHLSELNGTSYLDKIDALLMVDMKDMSSNGSKQ